MDQCQQAILNQVLKRNQKYHVSKSNKKWYQNQVYLKIQISFWF